ncbi:Grx4 family monothiol glutaredoxin [Myxococcus sp. MISCRS1]|jgi:monothiol glutaredoxin|uniref:Grx4 family monothiol glutaredoxin n=1 Tax=Myxococcus TaxID=32 RepID=UPI001CBE9B2A|nr:MULTISPECIES: Grx4 family monothiol glutaredoxin [unclassified Myxococcus]MBZ4400485.1 Grx4 family monothiol glutaredoxin [Myxococcus sp. AS-1-15]MBZ4412941.1 Grx4 family monothiol glutaredoxin [Myxococcus sp. XM-1-1-1]MCY0997229.1 Grx4 family monothiol glutaredoxin [Myxococcus sp. MISCRS1]BDT32755.1 Grx4 family monothiol glutaredoxin [Myxococcus sp. MH1]
MNPDLKARFDQITQSHPIVLFMKGNALFPQCGFSARALQLLQPHGEVFTVDVLADPEVRQGIKDYTNWPTIPQIFIKGQFVGGVDILSGLAESGELADLVAGKSPA